MKRVFGTICIMMGALFMHARDYVDYVNPLMGTQSTFEFSSGNTYPAIARPWGMNFWTPQTGKMGDGWQYQYTASKINGFKQTHQPSPWINDYGQFSIMPVVGKKVFDQQDRSSWFSHKAEVVEPHFYQVYLSDYDVLSELTTTERSAQFRFTYPKSEEAYLVIDAFDKGSSIEVFPEQGRIVGYSTKNSGGVPDNFKNYFVIEFDKEITSVDLYEDGVLYGDKRAVTADHVGAIIGFKTSAKEQVEVKVASSFISTDQADENMQELADKTFDELKQEGRDQWNDVLGRIDVEGKDHDQYKTFYSCLYRSLLFPRKFYEIDAEGEVVHYSPYNGTIQKGYMYTDTGFWDTFRSLFPLLNLVYPSVNQEIQEGLLNAYRESGFFPEWASPGHRGCMIGNNSASVLADAYLKGVCVEDVELLFEGLVNGSENVHPEVSSTGRLGHQYYNKLGYVPCDVDIHENAARTLEYAYNDWCIYQLGKKLGYPERKIKRFAERAMNYQNLFDPSTLLMRGKKEDGEFVTPFSPLKWGDAFTEGNSWHYTWSVFHDPQGLINLMGGDEMFVTMLDSVFAVPPVFDESYYGFVIHEIREMTVMNMGNYAHGNQPIQHMIYLYNYAGAPWKAQYHVRNVMDKMYSPTPDGYCGDEDNGQTSAWYVFSSLGFYPVCPGSDQYIIGSPLFDKATVRFEDGQTLVLESENNNAKNRYIHALEDAQGEPVDKNFFTHQELKKGKRFKFNMSSEPNKGRGVASQARPYSFSN